MPVYLNIENKIANVRLSNPGRANSMDLDMFNELVIIGDRIARRKDCRAVIITGENGNFSSGLDLELMKTISQGGNNLDLVSRTHGDANLFQRAVLIWQEIPIPVIAALEGAVYGAGLHIALGADFRIASQTAKFSIAEINWGLVPDMGTSLILKNLCRDDILKELIFTGREFNGDEALEFGLISYINETPLTKANELANQFAAKSPTAIKAAKRIITGAQTNNRAIQLVLESKEQALLLKDKNHFEAFSAKIQKREPKFED